jgi:hypothetical protein
MNTEEPMQCIHCAAALVLSQASAAALVVIDGDAAVREEPDRVIEIRCTNDHVLATWAAPIDNPVTMEAVRDQLQLIAAHAPDLPPTP